MPTVLDTAALPALGVYPVLPATTLTTGASPQTYDGTPAVVAITTGGTGGNELLDLDTPDLPIDGWFNPYLVGQRVIFFIAVRTDPADVVIITASGGGSIRYYPTIAADGIKGVSNGVNIHSVADCVCFVWCGDDWYIDYALTDSNFSGPYIEESATLSSGGAGNAAVNGSYVNIQTHNGASGNDPGGDVFLGLGAGSGAGRQGTFDGALPTSNPGPGKWWNNAGTVKIGT